MEWIVKNPELSAGILTSLVLVVALFFARRQLKDMAKDRHAQILLNLSNVWCSDTMQNARKCLAEKFQEAEKLQPEDPDTKLAEMILEYTDKKPALEIELVKVADFFEDIGLLVNRKMIHPPELILEAFAGSVIFYWDKYKKFVDAMRKHYQRDDIWEWFEYLFKLAKAYSEAKLTYAGPPETRPSAKHLFDRLSHLFK